MASTKGLHTTPFEQPFAIPEFGLPGEADHGWGKDLPRLTIGLLECGVPAISYQLSVQYKQARRRPHVLDASRPIVQLQVA